MQTIELTFDSGTATLAGSLVTDTQAGPHPTVLLVSGSGPIDRDSNTKRFAIDVMAQVADHLAREGLASFRYDKRGVGASGGDYQSAGMYDNVADARAAIEALRLRPDVDPEQVVVVGHSEGALIATELAVHDRRLAAVVLLAGSATRGDELLRWQAEHVSKSLPRPVKLLLRIFRQDLQRSQSKRLRQIASSTTDTIRIQMAKINARWFREFMAHDPASSLEAVRIPLLALTGSKDIQVDPGDVERICELVPGDCTGKVLDGLSHLLRTEAGPPSVRTYKKQAKRPVDATLLTTVSTWIHEHVTSTAPERAG